MKTILEHISDNRLQEFVDFLIENGEETEQYVCRSSYYEYLDDCDLLSNQKFSSNAEYFACADDFCDETGCESITDDMDGYLEFAKETADENFTFELERGLIKCERVINVKSDFREHKGHLGKYWTFIEGNGHDYGTEGDINYCVTICALVDPEDVDWAETVAANLMDPDEYELTLNDDAIVNIVKILRTKTKETISNKEFSYNA